MKAYEYKNAEGTFTIARVIVARQWRATLDTARLTEETLVTRRTPEAVLDALLANDLDRRPDALPTLNTTLSRLPRDLSEWRHTR